jgi:uncharacterized protein (TIGR02996 family)
MTDRAALLAAILADPADDTPRLVFADFLAETGDPADAARAAFIRAEVEAERLPFDAPGRAPLDRLAGQLYRTFADAWNRELPGWLAAGGVVRYRRGFVEDVELSIARFVSHGAGLFAVAPVTTLRLTLPHPPGSPVPYGVFGMRPELARVTALELGEHTLGPAGAGGAVRTGGGWLDEPTLFDDLMSCPTLANLRRLILDGNPLGADGVQALGRRLPSAAFAGALEDLSLAGCRLDDAAATALAAARGLGRVRRLNVVGNAIGTWGVLALRERFGDGLVV